MRSALVAWLTLVGSTVLVSACVATPPASTAQSVRPGKETPAAFYAVRNCVQRVAAGHGFQLSEEDPLTGGRRHLTATTTGRVVVGEVFDRLEVGLGYSARGDSAWAIAGGSSGRWATADGGWEQSPGVSARAREAADGVNAACGVRAPVVVTGE